MILLLALLKFVNKVVGLYLSVYSKHLMIISFQYYRVIRKHEFIDHRSSISFSSYKNIMYGQERCFGELRVLTGGLSSKPQSALLWLHMHRLESEDLTEVSIASWPANILV